MDKLSLIETVLGKGHKANKDYYQFNCPFCNHHKPKLGVSINSGRWKCWVCSVRGKSVSILFKKLNVGDSRLIEANSLWKDSTLTVVHDPVSSLSLPPEFKPLWNRSESFFYKKAIGFLKSRGVTDQDIIKHRLGYCESGSFSDMVIFPSYTESGQLNFFSARTYNPHSYIKFSTVKGVVKSDVIFDDMLVNWQEPIILCESKLDAIVIRRNAVPLYGKQLTPRTKQKIIEEHCPAVIFCLDGDAMLDAIRQSDYFIKSGIPAYKVTLPPDQDPSSLGYEGVWKYINNAQLITESETFTTRILTKLK